MIFFFFLNFLNKYDHENINLKFVKKLVPIFRFLLEKFHTFEIIFNHHSYVVFRARISKCFLRQEVQAISQI